MNNNNCEWRAYARVAAQVDSIVSVLVRLTYCAQLFFLKNDTSLFVAIMTEELLTSIDEHLDYKYEHIIPTIIQLLTPFAIVTVELTTISIILWADIQLFKATKLGRNANEAFKFARRWQVVAIIFVVLNINDVMSGSILAAIEMLIRCILLYLVWNYTKELNTINKGVLSQQIPMV